MATQTEVAVVGTVIVSAVVTPDGGGVSLLRAAANTAAAGEMLLRPAQEASHTDAGQLLRAATNGPAPENPDDHDL